jgi:hypothetical protein
VFAVDKTNVKPHPSKAGRKSAESFSVSLTLIKVITFSLSGPKKRINIQHVFKGKNSHLKLEEEGTF